MKQKGQKGSGKSGTSLPHHMSMDIVRMGSPFFGASFHQTTSGKQSPTFDIIKNKQLLMSQHSRDQGELKLLPNILKQQSTRTAILNDFSFNEESETEDKQQKVGVSGRASQQEMIVDESEYSSDTFSEASNHEEVGEPTQQHNWVNKNSTKVEYVTDNDTLWT